MPKHLLNSAPSDNRESGAVMIVLCVILIVLIGLVSLVVNFSYSRAITEKLQVAADIVAHSSAVSLCSRLECWNESLEVAHTTFLEQIKNGALAAGGAPISQVPQLLPVEGDLNSWSNNQFKITVMRGRWWPNGAPANVVTLQEEPKFEPFDYQGDSWQKDQKIIPQFLAANGVYVKIEQEQVPIFLRIFSAGFYDRDAVAVATGNKVATVCVSPFAIHACSLLSKADDETKGDYDPELMCGVDRIFTRANRFCEDGDSDCSVLPGFYYYPANDEVMLAEECNLTNANNVERLQRCNDINNDQVDAFNNRLDQCRYEPGGGMQTYQFYSGSAISSSDFYGVIGLPGPAGERATVSEAEVRQLFLSDATSGSLCPAGTSPAFIGDAFNILEDGLKQKETEDVIWPKVINTGIENVAWENSSLQSLIVNGISAGGSCDVYQDPALGDNSIMPSLGVCGSKRLEFKDTEYCRYEDGQIKKVSGSITCDSEDSVGPIFPCPVIDSQGPQRNLPIWQTAVAVIAPIGGDATQSCASISGSGKDPTINVALNYEIIGFVEASVFDMDIGNPVLNTPQPLSSCSKFQSVSPWGFQAPDGAGCNLVRARLSCEEELIASDVKTSPKKPFLVK